MIDFRYHLVSIVAVFLALGLGLLLGATWLRPYTEETLSSRSRLEEKEIRNLLAGDSQFRSDIKAYDYFSQVAGPRLLNGLLPGERVVLVEATGYPTSVIAALQQAIQEAGGTVTGQVQVEPRFFDTSSGTQAALHNAAEHLALPGTSLTGGSAVVQAGQVLASALLTKNPATPPADPAHQPGHANPDGPSAAAAGQHTTSASAAVNGLASQGFLSLDGSVPAYANLAIVVTPAVPPSPSDSNPQSQGLVTLAEQLETAGDGVAVTGDDAVLVGQAAGSGAGSAIDVIRTGQAGKLSTVDGVNAPAMGQDPSLGEILVVWALYEELHGKSGNYGLLQGPSSGTPSPAPSPSPSASLPATSAANRHHS